MEQKLFYTYILLCEDGSYYTGYSTDPERRFRKHSMGIAAKYTRAKKPVKIVYMEAYETRFEAMSREARIKKLSHKEKEKLINGNPYKGRYSMPKKNFRNL